MATDSAQAARAQAIRKALRGHAKIVWSNRLDSRMQALGVSVGDLADIAGTSYQTIWKIKRGDIYPREYLRVSIALALGAGVDDLFPMPSRDELVKAAEGVAA
jgi:transcriptional regulator with XRE-family HTH domain